MDAGACSSLSRLVAMHSSRSSPRVFDSPPPRLGPRSCHDVIAVAFDIQIHIYIPAVDDVDLVVTITDAYHHPPFTIQRCLPFFHCTPDPTWFDWAHAAAAIRPALPAHYVLAGVAVNSDHPHIGTYVGISVYFNSHRNAISDCERSRYQDSVSCAYAHNERRRSRIIVHGMLQSREPQTPRRM
ncbi:hypothetical protein D9619_007597 [Psilocybe cf. subviscida]|uniref:Uncharacterized protein n=1 Tax=Psilocybe cf. subviscida TaxID=2480587 RepID=A0A8H5B492_9AGAR|nr:hypothetical protein D9619_007597 [Psilocybe cf. subviscida]